MKNLLTVLIVASLALNAALAFYVFRGDAAAPAAASAAARTTAAKGAPAAPKSDAPAPAAEVLPSLATKELPALIAELRDAGFPPEVVRAIASGMLSEQFAARLKALDPDGEKRPFWKDPYTSGKFQQAMSQVWQEQRKALRALLGPDADSADPMTLARQRQQFGNLAPEKMSQVQDIMRGFDEKRQEVYSTGIYTTTEREKVAALDKQQRAAIAQVLSPAELEEYDLRSSNTGRSLRQDLTAFNPTEEEFRTIFKLRQPFDEQWNSYYQAGLPDQSTMERRNAASRELAEQIKAALGPVRGADYEITSDYNYRRVSQLVARLELPPETTRQLWDAQKSFQQRATEIRRNASSPADRTTQFTTLQEEATTRVSGLLGGNRGLEAYKQYGGSWLSNLMPRPPPAAAPAGRGAGSGGK